jgi:hypothetical protein
MLKVRLGSSIKLLLCRQLGLIPKYLEKRIQTIFLDGKPVDDVDSVTVKSGSILALSASLPGLAGATLRKGGYYAPMRSQTSFSEPTHWGPPNEGMIALKLFNLVLRELGPTFLKKGVWVSGEDLLNFFTRQPDAFWVGCRGATVDGEETDFRKLREINWLGKQVFLKLASQERVKKSGSVHSPYASGPSAMGRSSSLPCLPRSSGRWYWGGVKSSV